MYTRTRVELVQAKNDQPTDIRRFDRFYVEDKEKPRHPGRSGTAGL
jgi:hypothetical protein